MLITANLLEEHLECAQCCFADYMHKYVSAKRLGFEDTKSYKQAQYLESLIFALESYDLDAEEEDRCLRECDIRDMFNYIDSTCDTCSSDSTDLTYLITQREERITDFSGFSLIV